MSQADPIKLTYSITSYPCPRGKRFYGEAWDNQNPAFELISTPDFPSYTEARGHLGISVGKNLLHYFDGEWFWHEDSGFCKDGSTKHYERAMRER